MVRNRLGALQESKTANRIHILRNTNPGRFTMADELVKELGDTFLDYKKDPPLIQWYRILSVLKDSGYRIVRVEK